MSSSFMRMLTACFRSERRNAPAAETHEALIRKLRSSSAGAGAGNGGDENSTRPAKTPDELLWSCPLLKHACGEASLAQVQGNNLMEDTSQLESGPLGTFVGIYDGHGGPQTAHYVAETLYQNLERAVVAGGAGVTPDAIRAAFAATEESFQALVREGWKAKPQLAAVGSCALVGVVRGGALLVASLGDSRAVLGTYQRASGAVVAVQLSTEFNANEEAVRDELRAAHPGDADVVVLKNGVWRVKGIIQVSRSFGDVYLKSQEFQADPLYARFRLPAPLPRPVLSAEPLVAVRQLRPADRFVIFASDGLWEHLSSQEAVDMVHAHPQAGIARRLIRAALARAAKKREITYEELKTLQRGKRRLVHDDISVVVLFLDHDIAAAGAAAGAAAAAAPAPRDAPTASVRGGQDLLGLGLLCRPDSADDSEPEF